MKIKIKKLKENAIIPKYAKDGDAGLDLYSCEDYVLKPFQRHTFMIGLTIVHPKGYVGLIWDRSGNASKRGLKTMGGVIDSNYRGEWGVVLYNTTNEEYHVKSGDRIAQLVVVPVPEVKVSEVKDVDETERGSGGFGSTGKS